MVAVRNPGAAHALARSSLFTHQFYRAAPPHYRSLLVAEPQSTTIGCSKVSPPADPSRPGARSAGVSRSDGVGRDVGASHRRKTVAGSADYGYRTSADAKPSVAATRSRFVKLLQASEPTDQELRTVIENYRQILNGANKSNAARLNSIEAKPFSRRIAPLAIALVRKVKMSVRPYDRSTKNRPSNY